MGRGQNNIISGGEVKREHKNLPGIDRGFNQKTDGDLVLISPVKVGKMMLAHWPVEDRPFRSVIARASTGEIVSMGFPKFFNYSENPEDTEIMNQALANGERIWFGEKMDGSLAIRSVIDGKVLFRTRGSFDGGDYGPPITKTAAKKYPALMDPNFEPDRSLLFEFVSPDFPVVIRYQEDDLVFLGAIDHKTHRQADLDELIKLSEDAKLNLVPVVELPNDPDELLAVIKDWEGKEGVVARVNGDQTLVKMKAADYLARHRLRFYLTAKTVRATCLERNVRSMADFEKYLEEQNADWELVEDARPLVETYLRTLDEAKVIFSEMEDAVALKKIQYPDPKAFAVEYAVTLDPARKALAFNLFKNNKKQGLKGLEKHLLDRAFAKAEKEDELREV